MTLTYLENGRTLALDQKACTGCRMCLEVCPHNVFDFTKGKAYIARRQNCMECGACSLNCAASAIKVDSGVGCAWAILSSYLKRRDTPACGPECGCCD